ncbi:ATP-binding cassette domain-containing protein [Enterovibrio sp. ZSDZ35]|uniref:ATP-binding cassette domain-containing protein n=1 Tax=Enterovibrio qingdaonensis TaxID=2899818 RepID=A0ABT5QFY0_9GAMM|nr:ABC-F family ATP-binding cassette domain-containing protein [Enterovibrio sp. ZSDZ35]MDD1779893.1 ATP-binding cassette domain-containing protein [Enterovibrio sp. ZSDZ35]
MPILQASNLSLRFADGETLFNNISFSLNDRRTGLVGRNGAGKSQLVSMLVGEREPSEGSIQSTASIGLFRQSHDEVISSSQTIAGYLQVEHIIDAIKAIEAGSVDQCWFDLVGEQWDLAEALCIELQTLKLPENPDFLVSKLSGGQRARLTLWRIFRANFDVLILDEPTNHLDAEGQTWLRNRLAEFEGKALVISHNRDLLRDMESIWELNTKGLFHYGGNYDFYAKQRDIEQDALARKLAATERQIKNLDQQAQRNKEKAAQRGAMGERVRKRGGQPKILLNAMKSSASSADSKRLTNESARREKLQEKASALNEKVEQRKALTFSVQSSSVKGGRLLSIEEGRLPFGSDRPVTFTMNANQRCYLAGSNGSGKSTLLKVIDGELSLVSGECHVDTPTFYLDQHFSFLKMEMSLIDNLRTYCPHLSEMEARTLLAGIGFRRETVFRHVVALSGGEKMKLAISIITHQETQPLLLLDEPDNHLDLSAKILLASSLSSYKGALILVSHDQSFVDDCGEMAVVLLS